MKGTERKKKKKAGCSKAGLKIVCEQFSRRNVAVEFGAVQPKKRSSGIWNLNCLSELIQTFLLWKFISEKLFAMKGVRKATIMIEFGRRLIHNCHHTHGSGGKPEDPDKEIIGFLNGNEPGFDNSHH